MYIGLISAKICWNLSPRLLQVSHTTAKIIEYGVDGIIADLFGRESEEPAWVSDHLTVDIIKEIQANKKKEQINRNNLQRENQTQKLITAHSDNLNENEKEAALIDRKKDHIDSRSKTNDYVRDFLEIQGSVESGLLAVIEARNRIKTCEPGQYQLIRKDLERYQRRHQVLLMKQLTELRKQKNSLEQVQKESENKSSKLRQMIKDVDAKKLELKTQALTVYGKRLALMIDYEVDNLKALLWEIRVKQKALALEYQGITELPNSTHKATIYRQIMELDRQKKDLKKAAKTLNISNIGQRTGKVMSWRKILSETR
uniref:Uncharacterized protein n=1 Tax=Aplanochytrium stocchinoi TaxID=215587 RepID=A0A7S3PEI1_9STRA